MTIFQNHSKGISGSLFGLLILGIILVFFLASCACRTGNDKKQSPPVTHRPDDLIKHQQDIVKEESFDIESYIQRRNYKMSSTQTGLRYMIYENGKGRIPVVDDSVVELKYRVSLLDGSEIYNSESLGKMEIKVGKSEVASGLQEGLKFMKEGDKAIFIIPSHLAYGLTGDGDKIKQYQVLVVDVELVTVYDDK